MIQRIQMSPRGFILASAALVCAAPEGRDTRPRARTPPGPSTYCGQGYRCRGSGREMRCHPDAACDDRELRSGPCAVAAACLEKCVKNIRAAAMPTSIRDRILREHDVDVRLHAWLAARPFP